MLLVSVPVISRIESTEGVQAEGGSGGRSGQVVETFLIIEVYAYLH